MNGIQGEKGTETLTFTYDIGIDSYNSYRTDPGGFKPKKDPEDNVEAYVLGFLIIILSLGGYLMYSDYQNSFVTETVAATILGQELFEHHGAYGSRWYEYRNTLIFDNRTTVTIDSMDLMSRFRPKDIITIGTTYRLDEDGNKVIHDVWYSARDD